MDSVDSDLLDPSLQEKDRKIKNNRGIENRFMIQMVRKNSEKA
jgi:hypothetical protein